MQREQFTLGERLQAHVQIARLDHSIKNLFVLPGIVVPLSVDSSLLTGGLITKILIAFVSITLVACSNYVINEVLDAPYDRLHPTKFTRPAARGLVNIRAAYVQWILMMVGGVGMWRSPWGLVRLRPEAASWGMRLGRTRKVTSRPAARRRAPK